jgi:hypothetical protein
MDSLQEELRRGPLAHGWIEGGRWTLARVRVHVHGGPQE